MPVGRVRAGPRARHDPGQHDAAPCDVSDAAVPMFIVVPMDEGPGPLSCRIEFGKTFDRKFRPVFGGAEHSFGIRIVVADAWP